MIYALGYLDLKDDGPIVIEAPPGLQGILDDFRQRPICSVGPIEGKQWCGDVGLGGPDRGKGAKYLILPPDFKGPIPKDDKYLVFQSKTYHVFVLPVPDRKEVIHKMSEDHRLGTHLEDNLLIVHGKCVRVEV